MRDAVGAAGSAVLRLYEERGPAELGLPAVLRRGPRCPSLADVLEGLQDVERYYRHLYPARGGALGCAGGVRAAPGGGCFLLVVLNGDEATWRANCSCSASAWTAWQTWKPSRRPGRGFWSATKKTASLKVVLCVKSCGVFPRALLMSPGDRPTRAGCVALSSSG